MKKTYYQFQYEHLVMFYQKLLKRLRRSFRNGSFYLLNHQKQHKLLARIERVKVQMSLLLNRSRLVGGGLLLAATLGFNESSAQTGTEFRVNTFTSDDQVKPAIAMSSNGDFIVVWQSTQDGSGIGIYAQRYNNLGAAIGSEFRVNSYTTGDQTNPTVAVDSDGDFVVAWQSLQDGNGIGVYAQRYSNAGAAIGAEFLVNTYTTYNQETPSAAMDSDGDFVITWKSSLQDGSDYGVYGQRYLNTGAAVGAEFRINSNTLSGQSRPSIAMEADGDFVVAWISDGQDGSNQGIYAQRYNNTGVMVGSEFLVNTYTTGNQINPAVAVDGDGDFVITWTGFAQDGSGHGVYAQRYTNTGATSGGEFQVNTYTTTNQNSVKIAMDTDGDFIITWMSEGQDGQYDGVYAQRYANTGVATGSEFLVNTYTIGFQSSPSIAMDDNGDVVIGWQSQNQDGSYGGVYAQRYNFATNGIVSFDDHSSIKEVYPNPSKGEFYLNQEGLKEVKLFNLSGQLVSEVHLEGSHFSVQDLNPGVYFLEIFQGEQRNLHRLVIE